MKRAISLLLVAVWLLSTGAVQTDAQALSDPNINGTSAIVMDFDTGEVYYEKEADTANPIASMTKVMSLYLIFGAIDSGRLSFDTAVPISAAAAAMSSNPRYSGMEQLPSGGTCRADILITLTICNSACGSILALAEYISGSEAAFVEEMNLLALCWGIDAQFADCTGWIDEGNAVSARAMATIAKHILYDYPEILDFSTQLSLTYQDNTFETTNTLLKDQAYQGIDGLKSGYTYGSGYCFTATAQRDGHRIIAVVMNAETRDDRNADTTALLDYGFEAVRDFTLTGTTNLSSVELTQGEEVTLSVTLTREEGVTTLLRAYWCLDGVAVTDSQAVDFLLDPVGTSTYTLQTTDLAPGYHSLSFRIDPDSTTTHTALLSFDTVVFIQSISGVFLTQPLHIEATAHIHPQ